MIKTEVRLELGYTERDVLQAVCERLPIEPGEILSCSIRKRSLTVKNKTDPHYKATVVLALDPSREARLLNMKKKVAPAEDLSLEIPPCTSPIRPVVIGAGPAGLFAALAFAEAGLAPTVIERGLDVDARREAVSTFSESRRLDPECNIQYGEGGAGAFSDGKLKYGAIDKYKMKVLSALVDAGADPEILYSDSAHLGTDKLPLIIKNIRERIIALGGTFHFSERLVGLVVSEGKICAVKTQKGEKEHTVPTDTVVLATGHSARDVFEMLLECGVALEPRPFGIGVRVEHPREYINTLAYGENYDPRLPTASYHLVTHLPSGRSVYSFCMCPGGTVVAATSMEGRVVTNGMSEHARMAENSNSALLVSVRPEDFPSDHPLAGLDMQRAIEERAFLVGGMDYSAPAERMDSFMRRADKVTPERTSYPLGTVSASIDAVLPDFITDSLREAIDDFDRWMPGFYLPSATLTAAETRSTSPVRVLRNERCEVESLKGLYPAGEGAGYAGGIVSSAVDGLKCALVAMFE